MTGLLLLFGLAISAFTVGGLFDDNTGPDESGEPDNEMPDNMSGDILVSSEFEAALTDALDADDLADVEFIDGPLNVETGNGNDVVAGSEGADVIALGSGSDAVSGGDGDDEVDLGSGDDAYGSEVISGVLGSTISTSELGDDTVLGGDGNDLISDLFGSNTLDGGNGNDVIQSVDAVAEDGVTPDLLIGGDGNDIFVVDQGDVVRTGSGSDDVRIVLGDASGEIEGTEAVTIEDFDIENDVVQLGGMFEADDLRIETFADGSGSTIFWNDTAIVSIAGGQDLTLADIIIAG